MNRKTLLQYRWALALLLLSWSGVFLRGPSGDPKLFTESQEALKRHEPSVQSSGSAAVPVRSIAVDRIDLSGDRGAEPLQQFTKAKNPRKKTSDSVVAQTTFDKQGRLQAIVRSGRTLAQRRGTFGDLGPGTFTAQSRSYVVREDLQLVEPSDQQLESLRVGWVGNRWIIRRTEEVSDPSAQVGSGWIVEDSKNHRLGFLSGAVFLQFENWDLRPEVPYAIRSVHPTIRSVILQPIASSFEEFHQILAELRALQGVSRVEPEVLFKGAVPQ